MISYLGVDIASIVDCLELIVDLVRLNASFAGIAAFPGNVMFRALIQQYREVYLSAKRYEKAIIASEVIGVLKRMVPPARFLERVYKDCWVQVDYREGF